MPRRLRLVEPLSGPGLPLEAHDGSPLAPLPSLQGGVEAFAAGRDYGLALALSGGIVELAGYRAQVSTRWLDGPHPAMVGLLRRLVAAGRARLAP